MKKSQSRKSKQVSSEALSEFKPILKLPKNWNTRATTYPKLLRYGVAALSVLIAALVKVLINPYVIIESPFLLFYLAIVISSWFGGFRAGIFATVLATVITDYFFLSPYHSFATINLSQNIRLLLFILEGTAISIVSQSMHIALRNAELQRARLERSESRYRLVVDTIRDYMIFTMNSEGYITTWNEGGKNLSGYTHDEIIGSHLSVLYPEKEVAQRKPWKYTKIAAKEGRVETEGWRIRKDGSAFWGNGIITAIRDSNGKVIGFSNIIRDRTKQREIDQRKDEFISIASHELKTPLTSLKVFVQILQRLFEKQKDINATKYIFKINAQVDRLTVLINDLLDVSKIQAGKMDFKQELFDINSLVNDIVEDMQTTTQTHKIEVAGKTNRQIVGDKDRIGQVIVNFLTNAIKYSPHADRVVVSIASDKQAVTVAVQDFGIGIGKDYIDKVFDRFYRIYDTGEKTVPGLGMGLFISMEIIKRHNGNIWVESKKGEGSKFYFSLPYQ